MRICNIVQIIMSVLDALDAIFQSSSLFFPLLWGQKPLRCCPKVNKAALGAHFTLRLFFLFKNTVKLTNLCRSHALSQWLNLAWAAGYWPPVAQQENDGGVNICARLRKCEVCISWRHSLMLYLPQYVFPLSLMTTDAAWPLFPSSYKASLMAERGERLQSANFSRSS